MLIRFEAANFRSILHPVELSMVAVDRDRAETRPVPNLGESLLQVAAIFGPNASGKSNVIAALTWVRNAVGESLRFWDDGIPVEPFAFADGQNRPSEFTVESVIAGVRFEYVVELDRHPRPADEPRAGVVDRPTIRRTPRLILRQRPARHPDAWAEVKPPRLPPPPL